MKRKSPITYYYDEKCTKRCPLNENGEAIVDWGETIPGQKKVREIYAKNESADRIILRQPYTGDKELHITDFPKNLFNQESGKVTLMFNPNENRIEALKTDWGFDVVVG